MASLLLEGDDLEQLLLRAQREGGPHARIVRAEKVRHGGVMGFFAREGYEVALEIPDDAPGASSVAAPDPAAGEDRAPVEALLDRLQDRLVDTAEVTVADLNAPAPPVDPAVPDPERPSFTPFGATFEAALQEFGDVVQEAQARESLTRPAFRARKQRTTSTLEPAALEPSPLAPTVDEPAHAQPAEIEAAQLEPALIEPAPIDEHATATPEPVVAADHPDQKVVPMPPEQVNAGIDPVAPVLPAGGGFEDPFATPFAAESATARPIRSAETLVSPLDIRSAASLEAPAAPVAPDTVVGCTLAAPAPAAEILTVPLGAAARRPVPTVIPPPARHSRRRALDDTGPALSEMLDPVLAVERVAARSVAGQPLSAAQDLVFQVPVPGFDPDRAPRRDIDWERELALAAHTAAYAAVYASVHEDGIAGSQGLRLASRGSTAVAVETAPHLVDDPLFGPLPSQASFRPAVFEPVASGHAALAGPADARSDARPGRHGVVPPLPPAGEGWHRSPRHSSEWGTPVPSGHWGFVPTSAHMVIEDSSTADAGRNQAGSRPEFTALLDQLRSPAASEASDGRHSARESTWTPNDGLDELIPEPIAAEVARNVVDQLDGHGETPDDLPATEPASEPAAGSAAGREKTALGSDMVESIRRQAQAAIDEVYSTAGLVEDAMRTNSASAAIPMPRRESLRTISERSVTPSIPSDDDPDPGDDLAEPAGVMYQVIAEVNADGSAEADEMPAVPYLDDTHDMHDTHDTVVTDTPDLTATVMRDAGRLIVDQLTLRGLGVPSAFVERMHGGDRYADVWQSLEHLPVPEIDPDVPLVAVIGAPEAVLLEGHRVAVDLAIGDSPRPVVHVPAGAMLDLPALIGRHTHCVVTIETDGSGDYSQVLEPLGRIAPGAVIVVLDAHDDIAEARRWLFSLGDVDAIALDGVSTSPTPALMMQLGVPITRLDGIPIDRLTWTALLCAQLEAAHPA
ncbi:MAG: hypothetical protein IPG94_01685 [Kineosporiaceae bacterium]|nr:hypothetical protein [Kineosporiaceae bacterium]